MSTELHTHTKPWSRDYLQFQVSSELVEDQGTSNTSNPDFGHVGQPKTSLNPYILPQFNMKKQGEIEKSGNKQPLTGEVKA